MKRHLTPLVVFGFVICSWGSPDSSFLTNLSHAFSAARTTQKLVLLNFTSPKADWCQACKDFEVEVGQTTNFQAYAQSNFVFVVVDELQVSSPDGPTSIKSLEEKYEVNSWPTLIVLDAKGEALGRVIGYTKGVGCAKTTEELEKIRRPR